VPGRSRWRSAGPGRAFARNAPFDEHLPCPLSRARRVDLPRVVMVRAQAMNSSSAPPPAVPIRCTISATTVAAGCLPHACRRITLASTRSGRRVACLHIFVAKDRVVAACRTIDGIAVYDRRRASFYRSIQTEARSPRAVSPLFLPSSDHLISEIGATRYYSLR